MDEKNQNQNNIQLGVDFVKTPILYTDSINISTNEFGVVLDIIQGIAGANQAFVVARIGMSKEHAKKLITIIADKLATEGEFFTRKVKLTS
jgi:hypothetical protein